MQRLPSRLVKAVALTAALGMATATTASAHECYIASRSDQGNMQAGMNSKAWFPLVIADAIGWDVADGLYTAEQGQCILREYTNAGGPASFVIKVIGGKDGVLAGGVTNEYLLANGTGVDHIFDAYGEAILGAFSICGVEF
ncbi:MAG: hypothetical protein ABIP45_13205 [Knoellia sp.]